MMSYTEVAEMIAKELNIKVDTRLISMLEKEIEELKEKQMYTMEVKNYGI